MNLFPSITRILHSLTRPAPKPPTVSQKGIQARALRHLIAHGYIDALTVQRMGTTDARKMFTRMREIGVLHAADDACGHTLVRNASGTGFYRVHKWTERLPANWSWADCDRRKKPRGNR